ncbi:MAG: STAS domain-containing protein [Candidatus Peregrinibacteria bacterium]
MEALSITIEKQADLQNTHTVHFEGDFDGGSAEHVTELESLIGSAAPKTTLIFDFSKLNFLNSYAIGQLVQWHTQLKKKEGSIVITGTNKNVQDIFAIVGIHNLFRIFPSLSAALQALKNK